jgi:hypothetical protein
MHYQLRGETFAATAAWLAARVENAAPTPGAGRSVAA